jgi:hypothetical protein
MSGTTKLLTADRIGIGMILVGALAWPLGIAPLGLVGLGVIGPPLLRELGLLRDADDYTRLAMYRAGFHALLLVVVLLIANRILAYYASRLPEPFGIHGLYFTLEFLIQIALVVYAVSYVLQYWGARVGAARVLIGGCVFAIVSSAGALFSMRDQIQGLDYLVNFTAFIVIALAVAVLAGITLRRPRLGGGILLVVTALALGRLVLTFAGMDTAAEPAASQGLVWTTIMSMIWVLVLSGAMGVALMRGSDPT